jgi:hypothetical protein
MRRNGIAILYRNLCLLATLVCLCPVATAQNIPSEQSARAAMVFNFLRFAEFPPEVLASPSGIRLCVAVRDPRQEQALAALTGRKIGGRELTVQPFPPQFGRCHVLYVDTRQRWNAIADHTTLQQALTIGTYPGFARDGGGMMEIAVHNDGIRFDVNLAEVRRAGFHFSPQMLRLARQVIEP